MVTRLADVAERAGVSAATVSRVLNGNYPVATATRHRVEQAIRELDYVVNVHARALLHASSGMVGVVLSDVSDPFFSAIAQGVQSAASGRQRLVVICNSGGDPGQEHAYIQMLRGHRADAVILAGAAPEETRYRRQLAATARGLAAQGSRLVLCGRPAPGRMTPVKTVGIDNLGGSRAVTRHLLKLGHRAVAYLTGPPGRTTTTQRLRGFCTEMTHAGVDVDERLVIDGDFTRESGYSGTRRLLRAGVRFTAICAANDLVAAGALAALREARVDVPGEVSVVGFDDIPVARDVFPALTTVRIDLESAGRLAVELAFDAGEQPVSGKLTTDLVVRESTAPPRRRVRGR